MTAMENTRLEKVEDKMHELFEKQSEVSVQQAEMRLEIREILIALKGGDGLSVSKGLVPEVIAMKLDIEEIKRFKFRVKDGWMIIVTLVAFFKDTIWGWIKGG